MPHRDNTRTTCLCVRALPRGSHRSDEDSSYMACPQNVELKWMAEVSSSIYATPLITDLYSDGTKDIIIPSFVHYLEVRLGCVCV